MQNCFDRRWVHSAGTSESFSPITKSEGVRTFFGTPKAFFGMRNAENVTQNSLKEVGINKPWHGKVIELRVHTSEDA